MEQCDKVICTVGSYCKEIHTEADYKEVSLFVERSAACYDVSRADSAPYVCLKFCFDNEDVVIIINNKNREKLALPKYDTIRLCSKLDKVVLVAINSFYCKHSESNVVMLDDLVGLLSFNNIRVQENEEVA